MYDRSPSSPRTGNFLCGILAFALTAGCASHGQFAFVSDDVHARNVILFIGDGMGVSTVTAARIFAGQAEGLAGEEYSLVFEKFPHLALVKTYNSNQQVPDSAGTASAIYTGQKTRAGVISVGPEARRRNCAEARRYPLTTILEIAKSRGKRVGIVTTARITHATPAALYAHSPEREWESDLLLTEGNRAAGCRDIASQLASIAPGSLDIALGGGRREFFGSDHGGMRRKADDDLVQQWLDGAANRRYVTTAAELHALAPGEEVLGLFSDGHLTYVAERAAATTEPTLPEMTAAAIDRLAGKDGFFLMVEGGRIDHGHHDGKAGYALVEAVEFARAVEGALAKVDLDETLILVTADHSHAFTIGGYPVRGNPILGLVLENDADGEPRPEPSLAADGKPYTTVGYANGPGATKNGARPEPETDIASVYQALIPRLDTNLDGSPDIDESHGGEDVALYATGAGSDAVSGVIEQNLVFDIMMKAFGWDAGDPSDDMKTNLAPLSQVDSRK
ncbi:MAG TPA: alkaline phosphatase [Woeseiaceae bacterium]|nr:alkaline phosphatase [Woeseiaceae bacterium]